jgi:hypothetical protein
MLATLRKAKTANLSLLSYHTTGTGETPLLRDGDSRVGTPRSG